MDVRAVAERLFERLDIGDMRQQPELDLRIIRRQQHMAVIGDKGGADLAAFLGPDRNILQIGIVGRQPAGRGDGLRIGGVNAFCLRVDLADQRVGIGTLELGKLPPVQYPGGQIMALRGQPLEHIGAGRVGAGLALLAARQRHFVEQHFAKLLGRADVEVTPGELVNLLAEFCNPLFEIVRQGPQHLRIDLNTSLLHLLQHANQRPFDPLIDRDHMLRHQPGLEDIVQRQRDVGILGGVIERRIEGYFLEPDFLLSGAGDLAELDVGAPKMQMGQIVEPVAVQPAIQHIGQQHRVVDRLDRDVIAGQHLVIVFGVMQHLERARVFQHRLEDRHRCLQRNLLRRAARPVLIAAAVQIEAALLARRDVPDRDIAGAGAVDRLPERQRHADQIGSQRIERRGFSIDRDQPLGHRRLDPAGQQRLVLHQRISVRRVGLTRLVRPLDKIVLDQMPGRRQLRPDAGKDRVEALRLQKPDQRLGIGFLQHEAVIGTVDRYVVAQRHQIERNPCQIGVFLQILAALRLFDFPGPGQQRFQIAIFLQQQRGGLDADTRNTGHVIGGVAGKRLNLGHHIGADTEFFFYLIGADEGPLHRVLQADPVTHQLHQILVGGNDRNLQPIGGGGAGIGRNQIVGLKPFHLDSRQAERLYRFADQRELRDQIFRRRRAVRLVVGVDVAAKRLARGIEYDTEIFRLRIVDEFEQHRGKAVDRIDRRAIGPGHRRQSVIGAENIARAVDQDQPVGRRRLASRRRFHRFCRHNAAPVNAMAKMPQSAP